MYRRFTHCVRNRIAHAPPQKPRCNQPKPASPGGRYDSSTKSSVVRAAAASDTSSPGPDGSTTRTPRRPSGRRHRRKHPHLPRPAPSRQHRRRVKHEAGCRRISSRRIQEKRARRVGQPDPSTPLQRRELRWRRRQHRDSICDRGWRNQPLSVPRLCGQPDHHVLARRHQRPPLQRRQLRRQRRVARHAGHGLLRTLFEPRPRSRRSPRHRLPPERPPDCTLRQHELHCTHQRPELHRPTRTNCREQHHARRRRLSCHRIQRRRRPTLAPLQRPQLRGRRRKRPVPRRCDGRSPHRYQARRRQPCHRLQRQRQWPNADRARPLRRPQLRARRRYLPDAHLRKCLLQQRPWARHRRRREPRDQLLPRTQPDVRHPLQRSCLHRGRRKPRPGRGCRWKWLRPWRHIHRARRERTPRSVALRSLGNRSRHSPLRRRQLLHPAARNPNQHTRRH